MGSCPPAPSFQLTGCSPLICLQMSWQSEAHRKLVQCICSAAEAAFAAAQPLPGACKRTGLMLPVQLKPQLRQAMSANF